MNVQTLLSIADSADQGAEFSAAIRALTCSLLRGELVGGPDLLAGWSPDAGLIYELGPAHPAGRPGRHTGATSLFEAAEQLHHLIMVGSPDIDIRCRACGFLDPVPGTDAYDHPDSYEVRCVRCDTTDTLGAMRGVEPAPSPTRRARLELLGAVFPQKPAHSC